VWEYHVNARQGNDLLDFILYSITDISNQNQLLPVYQANSNVNHSISTSWNATTAGRYQQWITVKLCPFSGPQILALDVVSSDK